MVAIMVRELIVQCLLEPYNFKKRRNVSEVDTRQLLLPPGRAIGAIQVSWTASRRNKLRV